MFAVFIQTRTGLNWVGNETTIENAREVAEDFRARPDAEFVIVTPLAYFIDIDGERESDVDSDELLNELED